MHPYDHTMHGNGQRAFRTHWEDPRTDMKVVERAKLSTPSGNRQESFSL
jgi:hypothetical protein